MGGAGTFKGQGEEGSGFFHRVDPPEAKNSNNKIQKGPGRNGISFLAESQKGKPAIALWLCQGRSEKGLPRDGERKEMRGRKGSWRSEICLEAGEGHSPKAHRSIQLRKVKSENK